MRWYFLVLVAYSSIRRIIYCSVLVWCVFSCTFRLFTRKTRAACFHFAVYCFLFQGWRRRFFFPSCRCQASRNGWQAYSNHPLPRVLDFVIFVLSNIMISCCMCPVFSCVQCTAVGVTSGRRLKFSVSRWS
ncbi:unnamed protein product [Ectocarpus sp. 8 AP-2014]